MQKSTENTSFRDLYRDRAGHGQHLYPTEWVIRTLLGRYPRLRSNQDWKGQRFLDLGFGDGRNFPLLLNLGVQLSAVEPDQSVIDLAKGRFEPAPIEFATGTNSDIPFPDGHFDTVLACHSCYYIKEGETFSDNINEIARVLKDGGIFVFSVPHLDNFIFKNATKLSSGCWQLAYDPFAGRAGSRMQGFCSEEDVEKSLFPLFTNIRLGKLDDDYYGIRVKCFIGIAERNR